MSTAQGKTTRAEILPPEDPRDGEGQMTPMESNASAMVRGEIDSQIATARQYPRTVARAVADIRTMACISEDVAASCFYTLKRRGKDGEKKIEGGSIRFAEIVAGAWGNMRVGSRTTHEDDRFVYTQGYAWDMEKNVGFQVETRRRITDSNGRRYNEDMIGVTANASGSIARRNAIFSVVPRALWEPILAEAKKVAIGDVKSLADKKNALVEYYGKLGVSPAQLAAWLEKPNLDTITLEEIAELRGVATALKDGSTKIDDEFPPEKKADPEGGPEKQEKEVPKTLDQVVQQEKKAGPEKPVEAAGAKGSEQREARPEEGRREMPSAQAGTVGGPAPAGQPEKAAESKPADDDAAIDREIAQREGLLLEPPTEPAKGKKGK